MHYNIKDVEKEYYPQYTYEEVKKDLLPPAETTMSRDAYMKMLPPAKRTIIRDFLDLGGNKEALQIVQEKHSDKFHKSTIYDIVTTYKLYGKTLI